MSSSIPNSLMQSQNIFADIPIDLPDEMTSTLAGNSNLRIERLVSEGQVSPEGFWYDQHEDEWVILLQGAATLQFEGDGSELKLLAGDYTLIPAHRKHRISWTAPQEKTIWLAVFTSHAMHDET